MSAPKYGLKGFMRYTKRARLEMHTFVVTPLSGRECNVVPGSEPVEYAEAVGEERPGQRLYFGPQQDAV